MEGSGKPTRPDFDRTVRDRDAGSGLGRWLRRRRGIAAFTTGGVVGLALVGGLGAVSGLALADGVGPPPPGCERLDGTGTGTVTVGGVVITFVEDPVGVVTFSSDVPFTGTIILKAGSEGQSGGGETTFTFPVPVTTGTITSPFTNQNGVRLGVSHLDVCITGTTTTDSTTTTTTTIDTTTTQSIDTSTTTTLPDETTTVTVDTSTTTTLPDETTTVTLPGVTSTITGPCDTATLSERDATVTVTVFGNTTTITDTNTTTVTEAGTTSTLTDTNTTTVTEAGDTSTVTDPGETSTVTECSTTTTTTPSTSTTSTQAGTTTSGKPTVRGTNTNQPAAANARPADEGLPFTGLETGGLALIGLALGAGGLALRLRRQLAD
jgi:hypothetical protein